MSCLVTAEPRKSGVITDPLRFRDAVGALTVCNFDDPRWISKSDQVVVSGRLAGRLKEAHNNSKSCASRIGLGELLECASGGNRRIRRASNSTNDERHDTTLMTYA
jgi:hypothetical protein